jgi:hypothetical protein
MKLTEVLEGVGRPVAYYPGLRQMTGSTTATILLCQLFYWTGKEAKGDGWIYKSSEELTEETGLSYDEQVTARKHLTERGLLEEDYKRLEHKMYFRICIEQINDVWEIPETGIAKMGKAAMPVSTKAESRLSLNGTAETTQENTSDDKFKKIINAMQSRGQFPNSQTPGLVQEWIEKHETGWILKALELSQGKSQVYTDKILLSWEANGYPRSREEQLVAARRPDTPATSYHGPSGI